MESGIFGCPKQDCAPMVLKILVSCAVKTRLLSIDGFPVCAIFLAALLVLFRARLFKSIQTYRWKTEISHEKIVILIIVTKTGWLGRRQKQQRY